MSTIEREFYRTQREAGIFHAPWRDNATLQHAAGVILGIFTVTVGGMIVISFCARLLMALAGAA